jgi:thiol reductant ABC exporter CydC subunit
MSSRSESLRSLIRAARLGRDERRQLGLSVFFGWATIMAGVGLLATSGYLISRAAQRPEILSLTAAITAVRGFGVVRALFRYVERLVSHDLALRVLARLRTDFYAALAPLGLAALGVRRRGDLLARFIADVDSLQDFYLRALAPPLVALLVIIAAGTVAALMLPLAAAALVVCLLSAALAVPLLGARVAASSGRRQAGARARLTEELLEALEGSVELAVAGRSRERVARIDDASRTLTRLGLRDAAAGAGATTLQMLWVGVTLMMILLVAIPAAHRGWLSGVLIAALVMLALGAFEGLQPLPLAARRLQGCAAAASRLQELTALRPAVADPPAPLALGGEPPTLSVEHVSFAFERGERVLDDVSLTLSHGCRVALTGPSGTGKSTLSELLVRFADPSSGFIKLGDTDLRTLTLDQVRRSVVLVAQDAHVFTTSVRENLMLARPSATEPDLWAALRAVCLEDFVLALPHGLDTLVGEDGSQLSGGQRQRLTVARALVSDARFVVLDEPTAQLDDETAAALIDGVACAAGDRGLLVITHRLRDVAGFDEVYELRDGRLRRLGLGCDDGSRCLSLG